jgi:uncharacterized protein
MRITVHVTPRAHRPGVERLPAGGYRVAVGAPPTEGRANDAVIAALAEHFGVSRSRVRIVRGHHGRLKLIEIL